MILLTASLLATEDRACTPDISMEAERRSACHAWPSTSSRQVLCKSARCQDRFISAHGSWQVFCFMMHRLTTIASCQDLCTVIHAKMLLHKPTQASDEAASSGSRRTPPYVTPEMQEIFSYVHLYAPIDYQLDFKMQPFIPDYIPAVGTVDEFIKVGLSSLTLRPFLRMQASNMGRCRENPASSERTQAP